MAVAPGCRPEVQFSSGCDRTGRTRRAADEKSMRKLIPCLLLLCLVTLPVALSADTVIEEIIARVNNQIITRTEFQRSEEQLKQETQQQDPVNAEKIIAERDKDVSARFNRPAVAAR